MNHDTWFQKLVDHIEYQFAMCPVTWTGVRTVELQLNAEWVPHGFDPIKLTITMFDQPLIRFYVGKICYYTAEVDFTEAEIDEMLETAKNAARQGLEILKLNYGNLIKTLGQIQENKHQLEEFLMPR